MKNNEMAVRLANDYSRVIVGNNLTKVVTASILASDLPEFNLRLGKSKVSEETAGKCVNRAVGQLYFEDNRQKIAECVQHLKQCMGVVVDTDKHDAKSFFTLVNELEAGNKCSLPMAHVLGCAMAYETIIKVADMERNGYSKYPFLRYYIEYVKNDSYDGTVGCKQWNCAVTNDKVFALKFHSLGEEFCVKYMVGGFVEIKNSFFTYRKTKFDGTLGSLAKDTAEICGGMILDFWKIINSAGKNPISTIEVIFS